MPRPDDGPQRVRPALDRGRAVAAFLLLLTGAVGTWVLVSPLAMSMWHDEAVTVVQFIRPGLRTIITHEYFANNHTLYSILTWATVEVLGTSDQAFRVWSVVPGAAAVVGVAAWAWVRGEPVAAVTASLLLVASPLVAYWVPQARGYGLTLLAASGIMVCGIEAARTGDRRWLWGLAVFGFVGVGAQPHFAVPLALTVGAVALVRRLRGPAVVALGGAGLASVVLYLPADILSMLNQAGGHPGAPVTLADVLRGPFRYLLLGTLRDTGDLARLVGHGRTTVVAITVGVLMLLGIAELLRRRTVAELAVVVAPVAGTFAAFAVVGLSITDRTVLFLLPMCVWLTAQGVTAVAHQLGRVGGPPLVAGLVLGVALSVATLAAATRLATESIRVPIEAFAEASQIALAVPDARIVTDSRLPAGFERYVGDRLEVLKASEVSGLVCSDPGPVVYLEHPHGSQGPVETSCLTARSIAPIELRQSRRGKVIRVWIRAADPA